MGPDRCHDERRKERGTLNALIPFLYVPFLSISAGMPADFARSISTSAYIVPGAD